ncbi:hypothetical protein [Chroococcidiopsis sp. SAG 2025]|nr:hypothetical protein [Chroococcidiopsis sp. SAG 2025]
MPILASQILIPDYCDRHYPNVATVTSCQLLGSREQGAESRGRRY